MCLRFFLQGASYKETAQLLAISARTVETYMLRVKQRTGFVTRFEIEQMLF